MWRAWHEDALTAALTAAGARGNVGGRALEVLPAYARAGGAPVGLALHEGNTAPPPTNWSAWRVFVAERGAPLAGGGVAQLPVRTHGGSTSFGNPGLALLPAAVAGGPSVIVVSYFVFGEGAAPGEAGSLLFYKRLPA